MSARLDFYKANPAAIKAMLGMEDHLNKSSLGRQLGDLVRLRASQLNGCAFCMEMHAKDALKNGESDRRLTLLSVWRDTPLFDARERAALAWTEALTLIATTHAPDAEWLQVQEQFSAAELVDLALLIGAVNTWNRFAIGYRKMPV